MERILESANPSVGVVIGTFAALPYVHLHLESWRRHCVGIPILVQDDCSTQRRHLQLLCDEYGAEFQSRAMRLGHVPGDLSVYLAGIEWAQQRGVELLVKFSRRFIPLVEWRTALCQLAFESQYATYSGMCNYHGFGFRTEGLAIHVPSWVAHGGAEPIQAHVDKGEYCLVEAVVHQAALKVHRQNCEANRLYEALHPRPPHADGYGKWDLLGDCRCTPRAEAMWHEACRPVEYQRAALQYGIARYRLDDFFDADANIQ